MTPLNAAEAADLLRQREREFKHALMQVDHFGQLQVNERHRANRIAAEMDALRALSAVPPAPSLPLMQGGV